MTHTVIITVAIAIAIANAIAIVIAIAIDAIPQLSNRTIEGRYDGDAAPLPTPRAPPPLGPSPFFARANLPNFIDARRRNRGIFVGRSEGDSRSVR